MAGEWRRKVKRELRKVENSFHQFMRTPLESVQNALNRTDFDVIFRKFFWGNVPTLPISVWATARLPDSTPGPLTSLRPVTSRLRARRITVRMHWSSRSHLQLSSVVHCGCHEFCRYTCARETVVTAASTLGAVSS